MPVEFQAPTRGNQTSVASRRLNRRAPSRRSNVETTAKGLLVTGILLVLRQSGSEFCLQIALFLFAFCYPHGTVDSAFCRKYRKFIFLESMEALPNIRLEARLVWHSLINAIAAPREVRTSSGSVDSFCLRMLSLPSPLCVDSIKPPPLYFKNLNLSTSLLQLCECLQKRRACPSSALRSRSNAISILSRNRESIIRCFT